MLQKLSIRNYALIDNLEISFGGGLNILTGETGAGKSIILGALSLILGQRAESRYFFNQQKKCVIEGAFAIGSFHLKQFFFEDNDLDYEAETVLRREIASDGKSRAFVNDTPVNLNALKSAGRKTDRYPFAACYHGNQRPQVPVVGSGCRCAARQFC